MNIAELIYQRRSKSADPKWIADILVRLIWLLDEDCSCEILETRLRWLESGTHEQAKIALYFDEVFPYHTRNEMIDGFSRLQSRFPDLKSQCDEIVLQWDQQFPSGVH